MSATTEETEAADERGEKTSSFTPSSTTRGAKAASFTARGECEEEDDEVGLIG